MVVLPSEDGVSQDSLRDEFSKRTIPPRLIVIWATIFFGVIILMVLRDAWATKKEVVVAYCAQDQIYAESIFHDFEQQTGIKVRAVYDSEAVKTVGMANRLLAERSHPQCDVFWGTEEMRARQLAAEDVFRETNGLALFGYRSRRIVYNTKHVSVGSLP